MMTFVPTGESETGCLGSIYNFVAETIYGNLFAITIPNPPVSQLAVQMFETDMPTVTHLATRTLVVGCRGRWSSKPPRR